MSGVRLRGGRVMAVRGRCPACGGPGLVVLNERLECSLPRCPRPTAAGELFADGETEHVVLLDERGFSIQHPLIERLDGALMHCTLHQALRALEGPPAAPGYYRVTRTAGVDGWDLDFELLP